MTSSVASLGAPPRLIRNTVWNIAGQVAPLLVAVLTLPLLIRTVGFERFGFISLVWVLVGYASVFDFGISRALVRTVSVRLARGDSVGAHASAQAGLFFLTLFGLVVGAALALSGDWLVVSVLHVPAELQSEAQPAMWLLAASLPFVMLTTGYSGALSAYQRFRELNLIRIAMGVAGYLGPLLVALWINRLEVIVAFVLVTRVVGTLAHAWASRRYCGFSSRLVLPEPAASRELFSLGGWIAVSNVISPLLSYLDRLLLAALVPMREVAFYATPFDIVSKLMILPYSIINALFPMASAVVPGSTEARRMLSDSIRLLFVLMFPVVFAVVVLARPGMNAWLGPEFALHATPVVQVLAIGILFNALAQGPAMMVQAAGRPAWMATLHLLELPLFIVILWWLTERYGIVGTAFASAGRNAIDALAVLLLGWRGVAKGSLAWRGAMLPSFFAMALLAAALWPSTWMQALLVLLAGLAGFSLYAWTCILQSTERSRLLTLAREAL